MRMTKQTPRALAEPAFTPGSQYVMVENYDDFRMSRVRYGATKTFGIGAGHGEPLDKPDQPHVHPLLPPSPIPPWLLLPYFGVIPDPVPADKVGSIADIIPSMPNWMAPVDWSQVYQASTPIPTSNPGQAYTSLVNTQGQLTATTTGIIATLLTIGAVLAWVDPVPGDEIAMTALASSAWAATSVAVAI
jgi:hypothetical protein